MEEATRMVLDAALGLPEPARAEIVEELIATLDEGGDAEVDAAWVAEVERRFRDMQEGNVQPVSWAEAKDRASRWSRGPG